MLRLTSYGVFCLLALLASSGFSQEPVELPSAPAVNETIPVNWLYGAYIPADASLQPLNNEERFKLYLRQTYTTTGTYIKTGFFLIHDQGVDAPPGWGQGASGLFKRAGSLETEFIIQNTLTSVGDAVLRLEPRYDRCRCEGTWHRLRHAVTRNFVTYGGPENKTVRPQIVPFASAYAAGIVVASWEPQNSSVTTKGYQNVIVQIWFGSLINTLAEFGPDFKRIFHKN